MAACVAGPLLCHTQLTPCLWNRLRGAPLAHPLRCHLFGPSGTPRSGAWHTCAQQEELLPCQFLGESGSFPKDHPHRPASLSAVGHSLARKSTHLPLERPYAQRAASLASSWGLHRNSCLQIASPLLLQPGSSLTPHGSQRECLPYAKGRVGRAPTPQPPVPNQSSTLAQPLI